MPKKDDSQSIVEQYISEDLRITKDDKKSYKKKSDNHKVFYCPDCRRVYMLVRSREVPIFIENLRKVHAAEIRECGQNDCVLVETYPCEIPKAKLRVCFHTQGACCKSCPLNTKSKSRIGHAQGIG